MIRTIKMLDVPRVAEIHVYGWRNAYRGIVSDDYLFKKMLVSERIKRFEQSIHDNATETYVYDDGIIKAFMTIGACRDDDKKSSFELWGLYVDPFMQRQGIGTQMVGFCEKQAIIRGFNNICLWVLAKNSASRAFYKKMGYMPDGAEKLLEHLSSNVIRYEKQFGSNIYCERETSSKFIQVSRSQQPKVHTVTAVCDRLQYKTM